MHFSKMMIFTALVAASSVLAAPATYDYDSEYEARSEEPVHNLIYRRTVPMTCTSHNYNILCGTTHECRVYGAAPSRKHGAHPTLNDFCTHECSCRQPLAEISGNAQKKKGRR